MTMMKTTTLVKIMFIALALALLAPTPRGAAQAAGSGLTAIREYPRLGLAQIDGPFDPQEVEAFFDAVMAQKMAERHIPGAAIVVVKDGETLFSKGYGYADLDDQLPVDPAQTVFRVGSVSKLFTWTAAMQAVEQGLLNLNADVNDYLTDFKVPDAYSKPITLDHLMTHTPGFEDRWVDSYTHEPAELVPLGEHIAKVLPERVEAPGEVHSYSNLGTALGGYLVEEASGLPFAQYVAENIFEPLGMDSTTFEQPLPDPLAAHLATGYTYRDDAYEAIPIYYAHDPPEGGLSATAADMAAFMIAHLQVGQYQGVRILQEATAEEMHAQQFTHHSELPGMTYGFKERFINGQRVIGHGGDQFTFASQLLLLPKENEGFFVVYNRFDDAFREELISAYMDHFHPTQAQAVTPETISLSPEELSRFTGAYRFVRYPSSTIGKLIAFGPGKYSISISANDDGSLAMTFAGSDVEWRYAPVEPLVFKQVEGGPQPIGGLLIDPGDTLVFRENESRKITYGFVPLQNTAFEKLSWYEVPELHWGGFALLILAFLSPFLLWPLGRLVQRQRGKPPESSPESNWALILGGVVSGLNLLFMVGLLLTFGEQMVLGLDSVTLGLLLIPIITTVLAVVMLVAAVIAWSRGYWSTLGRLYYLLITLAALAFVWWANYWNLIGYRL
jgi:CubicO group peptidase (beta-lactamase class C family)